MSIDMSLFRVEKERTQATLTLSNGTSVRGCVFVSAMGATKTTRPERIKDILNAENGFFPFEVTESDGARTTLFHRDHVVFVTLAGDEEPRQDPGYEAATRRSVSMLLANGLRVSGHVRIYSAVGRDRLSDYARHPDQFRYLEAPDATLIVNTRHVLELTETQQP